MDPFGRYMARCGLDDLKSMGCYFTWHNQQHGEERMFSMIDRVMENQATFIQGRLIAHNILTCQDIVKNYGRKYVSAGCIIKMGIRKAYDSVDRVFMEDILYALQFTEKFIKIIMECVCIPVGFYK